MVRPLLFVLIYRENAALGEKASLNTRSIRVLSRCDFFRFFFGGEAERRAGGAVFAENLRRPLLIFREQTRGRWPTIFRPTRGKQFYANIRIFFCFVSNSPSSRCSCLLPSLTRCFLHASEPVGNFALAMKWLARCKNGWMPATIIRRFLVF